VLISAALLLGAAAVIAGGLLLRSKPGKPSPDGGTVTNRTDPDAPKTIISREITAFSTSFFARDPYRTDRGGDRCRFTLQRSGEGQWELAVAGSYEAVIPVDEAAVLRVQELIEAHELAALNGVYRVTAGLPPEYGPCSLAVDYASGEHLEFTKNGDPTAPWCADLSAYFFGLFAGAGLTEFLPPAEAVTIRDFQLECTAEGGVWYWGVMTEDGQETFYRSFYDREQKEETLFEQIPYSEELFAGLHQVIEDCGLQRLAEQVGWPSEADYQAEEFFECYLVYENSRRMGLRAFRDVPPEWAPAEEQLRAYLDGLFPAN